MTNSKQNIFAPILMVEDDEDHARLIKKALKKSGKIINEICHAKNGQEALDFLKKEGLFKNSKYLRPILILLDIKMPIKNGFEVLKEIKIDKKLKKIPVVILTTTATDEDIAKALRLGANDYIVKPIEFNDFTEKVRKLGCYWGLISDVKKVLN
ncbi:MAG: response regulator [Flavobacteriaceae bacterium]|nr:response regulator [Flavobacteriaceae bacterium]